MKPVLVLLSLSLLYGAHAPAHAQAQQDTVRAQFREAAQRAEQRQPAGEDSTALRAYQLYPDLRGLRLKAALAGAPASVDDDRIAAFLREHPALPVSRELQRDWLLSLARRELWPRFLAEVPAATRDPMLICHRYQARIRSGATAGLREELTAFWVQAPQMPQPCVAPFRWLQDQGLTAAQIETRARKALADNQIELAESLVRQLPPAPQAELRRALAMLRDPARGLADYVARPTLQYDWAVLESAFSRLARRNPQEAAALLPRIAPERVGVARYGELQRWVALGLAWSRRVEALDWFARLPPALADERVHEWRIKSALWHGRHELALQWVQQLPVQAASEPRWLYWRARLLESQQRDSQQAAQLYRTVLRENGYYALLAAARLRQPHRPVTQALPDDLAMQRALLQQPGLLRARELYEVDRKAWANSEWNAFIAQLDERQRAQAARLASQWRWHVQAVSTLMQTPVRDVFDILYPDAYETEIVRAARKAQLQPEWIYAVMRQESLFDPRAVSHADALGLLQLLLPTARGVARRWQLPQPQRGDLFQPEVNVPLGAAYLREMTDRFDNQFLLTLAAYNAGPNAVRRWLPDAPMAADIWIENVPFNETRSYLQRILWHISARSWRTTGEPVDLEPLLQPVRTPAAP